MVTIYRVEGLRVVIFIDDHEPAHADVLGVGQVKFDLIGPKLIWAEGIKRSDLWRAMKIVAEDREQFLIRRNHIPG